MEAHINNTENEIKNFYLEECKKKFSHFVFNPEFKPDKGLKWYPANY